jgi:hypothetical protein
MVKIEKTYQSGDLSPESQTTSPEIRWGENPLDKIARINPHSLTQVTVASFNALERPENAQIILREQQQAAAYLDLPAGRVILYTIKHIASHNIDRIWSKFDDLTIDDIGARLDKTVFPSTRVIGVRSSYKLPRAKRLQVPITFLTNQFGIENAQAFALPNRLLASKSELPDEKIYMALAAKLALGEVLDPKTQRPMTTVESLTSFIREKYGFTIDLQLLKIAFLKLVDHGIVGKKSVKKIIGGNLRGFMENTMCWLIALSLDAKIDFKHDFQYPYPVHGNVQFATPMPEVLRFIVLGHYAFLRQLPFVTDGGLGINPDRIDADIVQMQNALKVALSMYGDKKIISEREIRLLRQQLILLLINIDAKLQPVRSDLELYSHSFQRKVPQAEYSPPTDIEVIRKIMHEGDIR